MYVRSLHDLRFQSYIINNLTLTDEGFGYIKLNQDILDEYEVDVSTATNVVNNLTFIEGMYAWAIFAYDKNNDNVRGSIRSRGPIINDVAAKYNGGGHIYASGVRLKDFDIADMIIDDLNNVCEKYKAEKNN